MSCYNRQCLCFSVFTCAQMIWDEFAFWSLFVSAETISVLLHGHRMPSRVYVFMLFFMCFTLQLGSICVFIRETIRSRVWMCFYTVPGPTGPAGGGGDLTLSMVLMGWVVVALVLFLLRPSSLRGPRSAGKPSGPHHVSADHTHFS